MLYLIDYALVPPDEPIMTSLRRLWLSYVETTAQFGPFSWISSRLKNIRPSPNFHVTIGEVCSISHDATLGLLLGSASCQQLIKRVKISRSTLAFLILMQSVRAPIGLLQATNHCMALFILLLLLSICSFRFVQYSAVDSDSLHLSYIRQKPYHVKWHRTVLVNTSSMGEELEQTDQPLQSAREIKWVGRSMPSFLTLCS